MQQSFYHHKKCNYCGSKKRKLVLEIEEQTLYECSNCNLIYFDKQYNQLRTLYDDKYYSVNNQSSTANYANYDLQEKTIVKDFSFAYEFLTRKKKKNYTLLDIGAGYGYFIKHIPKHIQCVGNEVSHEAIIQMKKNNIKTLEGDYLKIRKKHTYDFITAFDVIEHQILLKECLEKVHADLNTGGCFIFTTPDYASFLNKIFKRKAPTIQPLYHNYYLTQKWLSKNLPLLGFKIIYLKTVHNTYMSINQIVLMASFALPLVKELHILEVVKLCKIENKVIPCIRFGGIQCIAQKI